MIACNGLKRTDTERHQSLLALAVLIIQTQPGENCATTHQRNGMMPSHLIMKCATDTGRRRSKPYLAKSFFFIAVACRLTRLTCPPTWIAGKCLYLAMSAKGCVEYDDPVTSLVRYPSGRTFRRTNKRTASHSSRPSVRSPRGTDGRTEEKQPCRLIPGGRRFFRGGSPIRFPPTHL